MAVFANLSNGDFSSMLDARLYLPKERCDDPERCKEARIPKEKRVFKTKLELATYIIRHQIDRGILFDFISTDGYYGNDTGFDRSTESLGYVYMLVIHSDQTIYLEHPRLIIHERKRAKEPKPKKFKSTTTGISVSEYLNTLDNKHCKNLRYAIPQRGC